MGYFGELQSGELNKRTENIYQDTTNRVVMKVQETQDAFIFSTLSEFAANNYNIVVEKQELVRAIQLIRMSKEYGPSIDERWSTATAQTAALSSAYRRGLQDGRDSEHQKFMDILEGMKRDNEQNNED